MGVSFEKTPLDGVVICEVERYGDDRGFFMETFHAGRYDEAGITKNFVQDNFSHSERGVLRGLHYQINKPQAKLVSVVHGEIYDVAVDIRKGSETFGKWFGITLSSENRKQLYVPEGFAHGFCVVSERADVSYKCTDLYSPEDERSLLWSDPSVGIDWPLKEASLSGKDEAAPRLADINEEDLPSL